MIYGKLPVTLLTAVANEKTGSTNGTIARYILKHMEDQQSIGIHEMAQRCNVSPASLSRFCKDIGLRDFAELRELLDSNQLIFEKQPAYGDAKERCLKYAENVSASIQQVAATVDMQKIKKLCVEIHEHKCVATFGLLKAETASINLQSDLLMQGKQIYTNFSYPQQMKYISEAGSDTLIIIFSYTGAYFDYQERKSQNFQQKGARIWMISGQEREYPPFVKCTIHFSSLHDQTSHPYQLLFMSSLIAQEYANLCEAEQDAENKTNIR